MQNLFTWKNLPQKYCFLVVCHVGHQGKALGSVALKKKHRKIEQRCIYRFWWLCGLVRACDWCTNCNTFWPWRHWWEVVKHRHSNPTGHGTSHNRFGGSGGWPPSGPVVSSVWAHTEWRQPLHWWRRASEILEESGWNTLLQTCEKTIQTWSWHAGLLFWIGYYITSSVIHHLTLFN